MSLSHITRAARAVWLAWSLGFVLFAFLLVDDWGTVRVAALLVALFNGLVLVDFWEHAYDRRQRRPRR
jgi:hypothetical protein